MAKRASLSLGDLATHKPTQAPSSSAQEENLEASPGRVGRPRTLPKDYRSMTLRLSTETHTALNVLAAQHGIPAKKIILDGIADQFARYGVTTEVK